MPAFDPKRAFAMAQESQEIRALSMSMGYKVQGRIVRFADRNGGARARSILELMRH
jgi:molecular chaperone GrpE (heat shock protein)